MSSTGDGEEDLHTVSTLFWVFRTYGHNMSCDAFERFKGSNGKFKECLGGDVKGMLMLYEAAHLGTKNEEILDEALSFSTTHLKKSLATATSSSLPDHNDTKRLIRNALYMPQHHNAEMIFAREFISLYEQKEDHDKVLVRFAKLNFKFLQLHWIQELKILTTWWKEQEELTSKLPPYFKERIVECYFFSFGIYFEPRFAQARIMLTKAFQMFTIVDDTCDRYGSLAEIKTLIACLERWVPESMDGVQEDYLKTIFKIVWKTFEEFERHEKSQKRSYSSVKGALEEFKHYFRSNLLHKEWAEEANKTPTYEQLMDVGIITVATYVTCAYSFLGLDQNVAGEEAYEWLKSRPNILQALGTKARLMNDMGGFEDDMSRGYGGNLVNYYMEKYGVTKEEAYKEYEKRIRELDKCVNEELLKIRMNRVLSRDVLKIVINFGKMTEVTYRCGEGYTDLLPPFNHDITSVFVDIMSL